jgi:hypothetical protein
LDIDAIRRRHGVVAATPDHARALAPIMRAEDKAEIWAAAAVGPLEGLEISLAGSFQAWTWLVEGRPACMFGIGCPSLLAGIGTPWFLSSLLLDRHRVPLLKFYRPFLAEMSALFPVLTNWVDARHRTAIRWLAWMGFTLFPAEPHGPFNLPHHRIELRRATEPGRETPEVAA